MRIISWNVYVHNKRLKRAVAYVLSLAPDVVCLQEVPSSLLPALAALPNYSLTSCFDWKHDRDETKHAYICTLTKMKPKSQERYVYDTERSTSIFTHAYTNIYHIQEQHQAIVVTLAVGKNRSIRIVNTRLSCAVGIGDRLREFTALVQQTKHPTIPTLYCGDFNILDNQPVNKLTGWIRGFTRRDYTLNERDLFEKIWKEEGVTNIFKGSSTTFYSVGNTPLLQPDHILVPQSVFCSMHRIIQTRFGSDHKILDATVQIYHSRNI